MGLRGHGALPRHTKCLEHDREALAQQLRWKFVPCLPQRANWLSASMNEREQMCSVSAGHIEGLLDRVDLEVPVIHADPPGRSFTTAEASGETTVGVVATDHQ